MQEKMTTRDQAAGPPLYLSRRESEIMDILYALGRAGAAEVQQAMVDPPGYSSVRKQLEILEEKGCVGHDKEGRRYIYRPTVPRKQASHGALRRVVRSFFRDDVEAAMIALLSLSDERLSEEKLEQLLRESDSERNIP